MFSVVIMLSPLQNDHVDFNLMHLGFTSRI